MAVNTVQTYLNLITSAHNSQPNFVATVSISVAGQVRIQDVLTSMIPLFDLDLGPVGDQLDIIGLWVGFPRELTIPVTGVYLTWDGTSAEGWDFGVWQDPNQPNQVVSLPDDVYLTFIRAKIAANHWDGTTEGAYKVWAAAFPTLSILIIDNENMTFDIAFVGAIVDSLTAAVITNGLLPLKPEGVRIDEYLFPVNTGPLFGWDLENEFVKGWDEGSWPNVVTPS